VKREQKKYYWDNHDKFIEYGKRYRRNNKEKIKISRRQTYSKLHSSCIEFIANSRGFESPSCEHCGSIYNLVIHHQFGNGTAEKFWLSNQGLYRAILEQRRGVYGFREYGPIQLLCIQCHNKFHYRGLHEDSEMMILEILYHAKLNNRMINDNSSLVDGKIK
jgi:hypothetical protein